MVAATGRECCSLVGGAEKGVCALAGLHVATVAAAAAVPNVVAEAAVASVAATAAVAAVAVVLNLAFDTAAADTVAPAVSGPAAALVAAVLGPAVFHPVVFQPPAAAAGVGSCARVADPAPPAGAGCHTRPRRQQQHHSRTAGATAGGQLHCELLPGVYACPGQGASPALRPGPHCC